MRQKWHAERKENRATLSGGPRHFICQATNLVSDTFCDAACRHK